MQPAEVFESSAAQQRTLCVNLEKGGRGFILNNHGGIDEGGAIMKDPAPPGTGLKRERRA